MHRQIPASRGKTAGSEATQMTKATLTRRKFMATSAGAGAAIAAPFVRTAGAAGSLSVGYWDHWVPGANAAMKKICEE